jgi:hypothetical protein
MTFLLVNILGLGLVLWNMTSHTRSLRELLLKTAKDCLDRPLTEGGGSADGMSIWFGTRQFNDGTYSTLLTHYENNYS